MKFRHLPVVTVFLLIWLVPYKASADQRRNLFGLQGVHLITNNLENDIIHDGLTMNSLRTDIELRMLKAGVKTLNSSSWMMTPGKPFLSVNIFTLKIDSYHYIYNIRVELVEEARLTRRPELQDITSITWEGERLGITTIDTIQKISDSLGDLIDEFISDYTVVNPK